MDANGLRFWMLADHNSWRIDGDPPTLQYERAQRRLRLASRRLLPPLIEPEVQGEQAKQRLELVPQARDGFGCRAYWDDERAAVVAVGAFPEPVVIAQPEVAPSDLAMGYDEVLYLAVGGRVVLHDPRGRWEAAIVEAPGFTAWRVAPDPGGGVWVLDREHRGLGRVRGMPLPTRRARPDAPTAAQPSEENPDPPRLTVLPNAQWPLEEQAVALACSPKGQLALLLWVDSGDARVRCLGGTDTFGPPVTLTGARRPFSLAWLGDEQAAVLVAGIPTEAPVYPLAEGAAHAVPVGDLYPLTNHTGGPFLHGIAMPPHYPTLDGGAPLYPLSLPAYSSGGEAVNAPLLDSGSAQTVWHRLYLEAAIPPQCGVAVWVAASDGPVAPGDARDWHLHRFGDCGDGSNGAGQIPQGAWCSFPSEVPYHAGLLTCEPEPNRAGLFTVLIQRGANRRVRSVRGRYLWIRVRLVGNGRATPEVAALRAYASRFSYVNRYLPELYQEALFGPDADALIPADQPQQSTPADFLERFVDNFEGILTPLEDRIASVYLLTDPRSTNEDALDWLASWIGVSFDPAYCPSRRRRLIAAAPELHRRHGTLQGLALALDVATGGAVRGGEVVILEDYRLRRTFATILGADLAGEEDPLLGGIAVSGNSYVGDTLFLGEETRTEFLALFAADLASLREQAAIASFFDQLADRVTVLVHRDVEPQDLGLIRRVVALESPAHVLARVLPTSQALLVGVAALVGVDTYLSRKPEPGPVRIGRSRVGLRDVLKRPASLDPRLEGTTYSKEDHT